MDEDSAQYTVELDADSWILVEIERQWPKYSAQWSIRRRSGDSDFPLASGTVERMPPADAAELGTFLEELRAEATEEARMAVEQSAPPAEQKKRGSFLGRLLGRG